MLVKSAIIASLAPSFFLVTEVLAMASSLEEESFDEAGNLIPGMGGSYQVPDNWEIPSSSPCYCREGMFSYHFAQALAFIY